MIPADDEAWAFNMIQLLQGDVWFKGYNLREFQVIPDFGRSRHLFQGIIIIHAIFKLSPTHCTAIGPKVGSGDGQFFHFLRMADGEQQTIDTAVAPANDSTRIQVEAIE